MCSSAYCVLVIANSSSMKSFACAPVICCGSCLCSSVLKTLPTVWCVRSHIALTCGFLLVVGTFLIRQPSNKSWKSGSINSPPLSWIQRAGHGYHVSQTCAYYLAMWADVLSSIWTSSTKFETVSIIVRALNSKGLSRTWMVQGPIKSTAHSCSHDIEWILHSGKYPYLACSAGNDCICVCRSSVVNRGDSSNC